MKLRKYPPELDTLKFKIEKYHREKRQVSFEKQVDQNVDERLQTQYKNRTTSITRSVLGK